jgi:hypothetical protein
MTRLVTFLFCAVGLNGQAASFNENTLPEFAPAGSRRLSDAEAIAKIASAKSQSRLNPSTASASGPIYGTMQFSVDATGKFRVVFNSTLTVPELYDVVLSYNTPSGHTNVITAFQLPKGNPFFVTGVEMWNGWWPAAADSGNYEFQFTATPPASSAGADAEVLPPSVITTIVPRWFPASAPPVSAHVAFVGDSVLALPYPIIEGTKLVATIDGTMSRVDLLPGDRASISVPQGAGVVTICYAPRSRGTPLPSSTVCTNYPVQ